VARVVYGACHAAVTLTGYGWRCACREVAGSWFGSPSGSHRRCRKSNHGGIDPKCQGGWQGSAHEDVSPPAMWIPLARHAVRGLSGFALGQDVITTRRRRPRAGRAQRG
jgi:hypothetical protein